MKTWMKIPVRDRIDLMRSYRENGMSYKEAVKDFEEYTKSPKYKMGGRLPKYGEGGLYERGKSFVRGVFGQIQDRRENKAIVEETVKDRKEYMGSPQYMKLLENEFAPDLDTYGEHNKLRYYSHQKLRGIRDERMNINKNIDYISGKGTDKKLDSLDALGYYTPHNNKIGYKRNLSGSGLKDIITHEQSHATDTSRIKDANIGGRGFTNKLYELYKDKGYVADLELYRKWINWENKVTDNMSPEEIKLVQKSKSEIEKYRNKELDALSKTHPFNNLPKLSLHYPKVGGKLVKMYTDRKTVEVISSDPKTYFEKHYPGLINDYDNWEQELKDIRLYRDSGQPKSPWHDMSWKEQQEYQKRILNNKWLMPRLQKVNRKSKEIRDKHVQLENIRAQGQEELKYKNLVDKLQDSQVVFNILEGHDSKKRNQIFNMNKIKDAYDKYHGEKPKDIKDATYYFRPTEVRARLNSIREAAVELGYKRGESFEGWIDKVFKSDRDNEKLKLQYDSLKEVLEFEDEEIEELMLRFADTGDETRRDYVSKTLPMT